MLAQKNFQKQLLPRELENTLIEALKLLHIYQGEVEHRDSSGGGGVIKPGDVQWMTAGSGLVHDEFHSREFCKTGGI